MTSVTSTRIRNRIRSSQATSVGGPAGLDVGGEGGAVVHAVEGVLDVALRGEDQRGHRHAGRQALELLGGQGVQPGQPVGALDPDHAAVGEVHEAVAAGQGALLAVEAAVVRGDAGVDALAVDGVGQVEQGAGVVGVVHVSRNGRRRPGFPGPLGGARGAGAEDGEVADVDREAVLVGELAAEALDPLARRG